MASIEWIGLDKLLADLAKAPAEIMAASEEALDGVAQGVLAQAQQNIASTLKHPDIDTGEVIDSGRVDRTPGGAEVIFDHRAAFFVHEGVRGNEPHRKYLERPALEAEPDVAAVEAEVLKRVL